MKKLYDEIRYIPHPIHLIIALGVIIVSAIYLGLNLK